MFASVHVETLVSTTIVVESTTRTCLVAAIIVESGGGCGAAVAWGGCAGPASITRRAGVEKTRLEAAAPEDWEVRSPTRVAGEKGRVKEAFLDFFFFFSCSTVEDGGRITGDHISAAEDGEEATGEDGDNFEHSDEGSDQNRAPEEDELDSSDIFLKRKGDEVNIKNPRNLPKTLNHSKNGG